MSSIWVGVDPRPPKARVLAVRPSGEAILKARLEAVPKHPRALAVLLESLSLWQGVPIHAALAVGDEEPWCQAGQFHIDFDDFGQTPLYSIELVSRLRRPSRREALAGLGDFRDLRKLAFDRDF
jgi:hypothetical protein